MDKPNSKAKIMERAKNLTERKIKEEAERVIEEADENFFLDRMLALNKDQLHNTRMAIKRLMKEGQLLRNIKKKWNK